MLEEEFMVLPEGLPLKWVDEDNLHTLAANQFVLTTGTPWDEVILAVGQVSPPVLIGTHEEQLTQVEELDFLPVRMLARFSIPISVAKGLRDLLNRNYPLDEEGAPADE